MGLCIAARRNGRVRLLFANLIYTHFSDEVVALKRLKMEKEKEGFPITSLREINMLLKAGDHENVVRVRVC